MSTLPHHIAIGHGDQGDPGTGLRRVPVGEEIRHETLGGELYLEEIKMSVPFYYNHGPGASAQMKADLKRVRLARPDRYLTRKVKESRVDTAGKTTAVIVDRQPDAVAISPRERHYLSDTVARGTEWIGARNG
jgi:hypothetical protein